jgi:hypothetical protein
VATTLTGDGELTSFSFPIIAEKTEEDADGNLIVYGVATDGSVDSDEQIVDPAWAAKAVREWLETGPNLRVQHQSQRDPAGVGISMETGPNGETYVKSRVIETEAKRLVKGGALRAYSVGIARPKIVRDNVARGGRIVDGEMCEISLVDRPANKNCGIQLVTKSADGSPEWIGKAFGPEGIIEELKNASEVDIPGIITKLQSTVDTITKTASVETVSVDLPKDVSVSFSPSDLAKLLKHRAVAEERVAAGELTEKRKMDPDVGGGVDRDKIPAEDFAGKDRSFPIVTPGDVSDAASSIGRAGDDNYSSDKLKASIIRIARRKGAAFVAELPDSWKKELRMNKAEDFPDVEKKKKGKKKPFPGAKEPFGPEDADGKDSDGDGSDVDEKDSESKPDTTKGSKDCLKCGKSYDADTGMKRCEGCNAKLPKVDKSVAGASAEKKAKVVCQGCGAMIHNKHSFCPECGNTTAKAKPLKKNHNYMCLGCDQKLDKGEKFCGGCGKENPGYLPGADSKVKVSKNMTSKPVPGEGVVGPGAAGIEPVPAHREPDGTAIENFEHDADLPTDPDSRYMKTADRFKGVGAPSDVGALHDHLCAAFHPSDVAKCFPSDAFTELSVGDWQQKALDAAASAPLDEARRMTQMWQHAVTLKGTDPEVVAEIREELHKEFTDANKGPGTFPTPTELSPTRFNRPYITGGHAHPSPGHGGPNTHSVPTSHISADDFGRGPLTAGQAEDSPANKGTSVIEPAPLPPGMSRTYYRNAQRDSAKSAMQAMHDHIAQTFPDLCPMGAPGLAGAAPAGERPVPVPVGKSEDTVEDTELAVKAQKLIEKARKAAKAAGLADVFTESAPAAAEAPEVAAAPAFDPEIVKSAVAEATAPLVEQLVEAQKALKKQQKRLDALADIPDPRDAPFKGLAMKNVANKSAAGVPVAATTVAENAERTQMALMEALKVQANTNPDPAQREAAWGQLYKMMGVNP